MDDKTATIGTANIDGPSLNYADEFKFMVDLKCQRSMEINAFLMKILGKVLLKKLGMICVVNIWEW